MFEQTFCEMVLLPLPEYTYIMRMNTVFDLGMLPYLVL